MFAERGLTQHRLRRLVAEADRRPDMAPPALVVTDHAALEETRVREGFGQRVDAAVADIESCKIILPLRQRLLPELGGKKLHHRLLMRSGAAQTQFGQLGAAEHAQQVMDEL